MIINKFLRLRQVQDYAERKGMPVKDVEKWLNIQLAYDRDEDEEDNVSK